jgi:bromodomain-containing protein 3
MSTSSSSGLARGRSKRERVIPAHLREDNDGMEQEQVPMSLKKCLSLLKSLCTNPKAIFFLEPVDPIALGIPDYFNVIKEPMDLGTIRQHLEAGQYTDPEMFAQHVRLTFQNAMVYNASHSQVHQFAQKLLEDFEKRFKNVGTKGSGRGSKKEKLSKKEKKALAAAAAASSANGGGIVGLKIKVKGGKGVKGNSKRTSVSDEQGLIMSLKEDIERLKATLEQLQPRVVTPKPARAPGRPFRMEDLTEEELREPMTQMEKARLSSDIKSLPQDKINRVLQIIAEAVPVAKFANENDEVELDINALDTRCLRMLEGYVRVSLSVS